MNLLSRRSSNQKEEKAISSLYHRQDSSLTTIVCGDESFTSLADLPNGELQQGNQLLDISERSVETRDLDIVYVSRTRIQLGKFLGKGSFARVFRVSEIISRKGLGSSLGDSFRFGSARQLDVSDRGTRTEKKSPFKVKGRRSAMRSFHQSMRHVCDPPCRTIHDETQLANGRYAVKLLDRKKLKNAKAVRAAAEDLRTEVGIMKLCRDCPHVLQVRALPDIDDADWTRIARVGSLFIMTDELNETLDHRIDHWREHKGASYNSPSLLSQKTRYALQLCSALKFLHDHRIVYRDLKPENVGFMANNDDERDQKAGYEGADRIQLFDFGLCRELPAMTTIGDKNSDSWKMFYSKTHEESDNIDDGNTGVYCLSEASGTPKYLAGEVVMSGGYCNLKCDVYSWAMVFFEMLSDERAFPGFSVDQLEEVIWKRGSRPSLSKSECLACLPSSITSLLKKSWSKFVYKRPTSEACCKELESILLELQK